MKILQVIPYFAPAWGFGGSVRVAYELSKQLVKSGHKVTVYTSDTADYHHRLNFRNQPARVSGIKVYYFSNFSLLLSGIINDYSITPLLARQVRSHIKDFDIIHIHEYRSFQQVVVCHYARKYNIPYVLQAHASTPRVGKRKLKWLFDTVFGYKILRDAANIIAVSKEEAEHDEQMGVNPERMSVIYNGMDIEAFRNLLEKGKFKANHEIDGRIILYLGRINKTKGIDFAIKGFSEICKEVDQLTFVIAGSDDGYKKELEKLIKDLNLSNKIKFTGPLDEEDKLSAYVDADLFVHTVRYMGGVGIAPLEAILCGTPVIVTDECGEVIKEANCGYFVQYGDVAGLKAKMRRALENPEEGKQMVERGKKYIMENLTWEMVARRVEAVYASCLLSG